MTTPALDLKNVRKQFGSAEIIRGVNLSVQPGERVAIIDRKSTRLNSSHTEQSRMPSSA